MSVSKFKFNNRRKHPVYVYAQKNDKYYGLLLTHSPKSNGKKNVRLYANPNPRDLRDTYVSTRIYKDNKNSYRKKTLRGWKFHLYDKRKIKRIKKQKKF